MRVVHHLLIGKFNGQVDGISFDPLGVFGVAERYADEEDADRYLGQEPLELPQFFMIER